MLFRGVWVVEWFLSSLNFIWIYLIDCENQFELHFWMLQIVKIFTKCFLMYTVNRIWYHATNMKSEIDIISVTLYNKIQL